MAKSVIIDLFRERWPATDRTPQAVAMIAEGAPRIAWSWRLAELVLYSGIVAGHHDITGLLATPVLGITSAAIGLNEPLDPSLFLAMALIVGGIALGREKTNQGVQMQPRPNQAVTRDSGISSHGEA